MKKFDVVKKLLQKSSTGRKTAASLKELLTPKNQKGLAFAPVNIALCKYWGKRNSQLNLPVTSSLSIALPDRGALTNIAIQNKPVDIVKLNGKILKADSKFVKRVGRFLDLFRPDNHWHLEIDINMNVPLGVGLASAACGIASLAAALNDLFGWRLAQRELSILARLGSGSAARSLWTGFVEWHAGVQSDGMDSYGEPLPFEWPDLCVGILSISERKKSVGAREAMQRTQDTSLLYANWPKKVTQDIIIIKQALHLKNFALFGGTAESNALAMQAIILGCWPPICYFLPETIASMHKVWALRSQGLELYFTEDAGPNLKLLFQEKNKEIVKENFPKVEIIKVFEQ